MKNKKDIITISDYVVDTSNLMAYQFLDRLEGESIKLGKEHTDDFALNYLACILGGILYRNLCEGPYEDEGKKTTKKEKLEFALKNFSEFKARTQDAIAVGFQSAMSTFSGRSVDYYCEIKPIPEPINKEPC